VQKMPTSYPDLPSERLMSEIECKEALEVTSSATVDLSVSGRFEARARRSFPLRSARLLTMEWE
jgi:hypothetical protein